MDGKINEFLALDSYQEQMDLSYKVNNIIREKTELYYDFVSSLLDLIEKTYLGPDIIETDEDMWNHFQWCYNRIVIDFEQEKIYFKPIVSTGIPDKNSPYPMYVYLWVFFHKSYYTCDNDDKYKILSDYFKNLFNFPKLKSPIELETFIEIYKMFDQNLKKLN
jgi:hypothetical protein